MNLRNKIIKESILVLIITAFLSSFGGFFLESVKAKILMIAPFIIMLPALNDFAGDTSIVLVSKISTHLAKYKLRKTLKHKIFIKKLLIDIVAVNILITIYIAILSSILSRQFTLILFLKVLFASLSIIILLVTIISIIVVIGSIIAYKKGIEPDDLLIPIATSIADFGVMGLLALFTIFLF